MRHRVVPLIGLIFGAYALSAAACAAEPGAPRGSVLEGVTALEKPVTYTETKIPLGELVRKVAADTGAPLTTAPGVADEPVAVVVKDLPARELLEQLAELLDYRWMRQGKAEAARYEVYQDVAGKQNEESLRQAAAAGVLQRLQEQVRRCAEVAREPAAQIQAEMDALEQRGRQLQAEPRDQEEAFLKSPEGQAWGRRAQAVETVSTPVARALVELLARLTPRQWALLRSQPELVMVSGPEAGAAPAAGAAVPEPRPLPLPGEIVRLLRAASPDTPHVFYMGPPDPAQPERDRQWAKDRQAYWASASGYRVTLQLDSRGYERSGKLILTARVAPIAGEAMPEGVFRIAAGNLRLESPLVDENAPPEAETPERRAALGKDSVLGRKETYKPQAKPHAGPFTPGSEYAWLVVDLLPELAQTYHAQFIADSYWGSGILMGLNLPLQPAAFFEELDALAGPSFHWDRVPTKRVDGGYPRSGCMIRLRSRSWFLERPREIPLRFVRQWLDDDHRYGSLTFDDYLAMATQLTDLQLQHVGDLVINRSIAALPIDLYDIQQAYPARFALRLYASLTPAQQQELSAAGKLPVARLTPVQQALFLAGLREPDPHYGGPPGPPPAQEEEEASFAISSGRWIRTALKDEEGGTSYMERPEPAPGGPPGAGPGAGAPGSVLPAARPPSLSPPGTAAASGGASPRLSAPQAASHSFTRVQFLLSDGSKARRSFSLNVAVP
jgi:hypothetical protein